MPQWVLTNAGNEKVAGPLAWRSKDIQKPIGLHGNKLPPLTGYTANGLTLRSVTHETGDGGEYVSGDTWVIETPEAATPVPDMVSRADALTVLLQADTPITEAAILAKIALIADATDKELARIDFYRPYWKRNSSLLVTLATAFSLSSDDIDDMFIAADAL